LLIGPSPGESYRTSGKFIDILTEVYDYNGSLFLDAPSPAAFLQHQAHGKAPLFLPRKMASLPEPNA
jgi:hypothetical protein